jgi:hypothetical protein
MANKEHLKVLKKGVTTWNEWRKNNHEILPVLEEADLFKANLSRADLSGAKLSEADFKNSILEYTKVANIDLSTVHSRQPAQNEPHFFARWLAYRIYSAHRV